MLTNLHSKFSSIVLCAAALLSVACGSKKPVTEVSADSAATGATSTKKSLTQPLISNIYTADPSAHVFNGKLYIYPSHDYEAGVPEDDYGSHFAMRDYH